ncbi:MAG: DUF4384 domain-containing protein [Nitrospirae bacterium]|nr:DUF4384 domain-containing protein [Nitrospirota bacterium]
MSGRRFGLISWLGNIYAAVCGGMSVLLLCSGTVTADPLATVTVVAQGLAPFLKDMSLDEVRGRARDEARRNAIEQAVGVFVRGATVVHNSQITDELIASVARGVIEEEQWVEEKIEEVQSEKTAGPAMAVYRTKVKALVRPVRVERRAGFDLRAALNKQVFQDGEEALIKIRSSQPAYLHLFSVMQDGSVTLLLPNRFLTRNLLAADQEMIFPSETLRALGIKLRVVLPKESRKVVEYIKVIATRKPIHLVKDEAPEGAFQTFSGTEGGMIQDVVKRLALLEDEDWTEATLPYEVRQ